MSHSVKITADSTCDLPAPLRQKYDLSISPLYINMGEKAYRDGIDLVQDDIYRYVKQTGDLPKTSAVTVSDYLEFFAPFVKEGKTVIHFTICRTMSCCYQNAVIAAKELGNVCVVDSGNLSCGISLLALRAAELAEKGMEAGEIVKTIGQLIPKVETSFVVDTLRYLHKGGRCSAVAALGANLLALKPCIEVLDEAMTVGKKYRGNLGKCLSSYVADRLKGRTDLDLARIFIVHSSMPDGVFESLVQLVKELSPFKDYIEADAGSTICSHCGPGTFGLMFLRK